MRSLLCLTLVLPALSPALSVPAFAAPPPYDPVALRPSETRLRGELMERFARQPLQIPKAQNAGQSALVTAVPGGPSFVLATDDDRSLQTTNWSDGTESQSGLQLLAQKYYEKAPDNVQFIVTYTSWRINNLGAFYVPMANDITGIGYENPVGNGKGPNRTETFDYTGDSPLDGMLLMNGLDAWGAGSQATWVFNQELGHRWGTLVRFVDGSGQRSDALLGRDLEHWSYFLGTAGSPMEGNTWRDNGDGTFSTEGPPRAALFTPLDLYLMGLAPKSDVTPMTLIQTATADMPDGMGGTVNRASQPEGSWRTVTIPGTKTTVTIDQVLAAEKERVPAYGAAPREFHIGFLFVVKPIEFANKTLLAAMQQRVDSVVAGWEAATGGRGHLVVESHGVNPELNPPGTPCPSGPLQCDPQAAPACAAPLGTGAPVDDAGAPVPVCATPCGADGKCAGNSCCLPATDGNSYCFVQRLCAALDGGAGSMPKADGCSMARERDGGAHGLVWLALSLPLALLVASRHRRRKSA